MKSPAIEIRRAVATDLAGTAELVGRLNSRPTSQSLHCAAQAPGGVRAALRDAEIFPNGWESNFVVGVDPDGKIAAAVGFQLDAERSHGWIWGPWSESAVVDAPTLGRLWEAMVGVLPRPVASIEAFLHEENRAGLRFLGARGFRLGSVTHLYVVRQAIQRGIADESAGNGPRPHLRPAHEVAFARLHTETFPAGRATSAEELLAGRDEEHAIFAAVDVLRLLGYVCVSVNRAPREGFIEYLAVRPSARGRGLGERLLRMALEWSFAEKRLPQAALCVSDWREGAHRLYERVGFRREASGIAARRKVEGRR